MNDVDWGVRAAAWELAALSFRYPGAELAGAVASGEWAEAAREIAGALGLALPEGLGEGLSGRSGPGDASAEGLRPEATRLFEMCIRDRAHAVQLYDRQLRRSP